MDAEGRSLGPLPVAIDEQRIAAYVDATGDEASRWTDVAPPGYAAAALFAVAPAFLFDPALMEWTRLLVHGDQSFTWHQPFRVGEYSVEGSVDRVRLRQGTAFVAFSASMVGDSGVVLESKSTFLMGTEAPPAEEAVVEPDVDEVGKNARHGDGWLRSASRRDLVRYAAATGDFNPIHWDHERALAAGLPGIVCHGLLMTAWVNQAVTEGQAGEAPLAEARYRFRNPLRSGEQGRIATQVGDDGRVSVELSSDGGTVVTASLTVRT